MLYEAGIYQENNVDWLQAKLNDVDWDVKRDLAKILDNNHGSWRDLVAVLPDWLIVHIPVLQLQNLDSPSWALLQKLEQWGFTVAQLISCLESLKMENALHIIKPDVELRIVEDIASSAVAESGETLQLTCRATGFPTPQYQWYKNDQELIEHIRHRLTLTNLSPEDAGTYHCKVYNFDRVTREERVDHVLSNRCEVKVDPPFHPAPQSTPRTGHPPVIEFQPRGPEACLPQGCSFTLECKATGDEPISYQWFKDQELLHGKTGSELHLRHLMPDEETEMNSWQYLCAITNPYGTVLSNSVTIKLSSSREHTLFTAKDKVALLIGNETYEHMQSFTLPSSDVATLSKILKSLNFRVMSYMDLKKTEMVNAVHQFCSELSKGSYGFFYYAGHGFEYHRQNYMQPVDATEFHKFYEQNVSVDFVASIMQKCDAALNCFILDMCRESPPYRESSPTLPLFVQQKKYNNIFFAYATSSLGEAVEVEGDPNGLFVHYLKNHLADKKPIWEVICAVKHDMSGDRLARSQGQDPSLDFNISEPLTLRDPILHPSEEKLLHDQRWLKIYTPPFGTDFKLGSFRFVVTFRMHKETFCNALDMDIHFKEYQTPSQPHKIILKFWPDSVKIVPKKRVEPEYLKYTLKGLQTLQGPVEYQILLKTDSEEFQSSKYSFSMRELMALDLTRNVL